MNNTDEIHCFHCHGNDFKMKTIYWGHSVYVKEIKR